MPTRKGKGKSQQGKPGGPPAAGTNPQGSSVAGKPAIKPKAGGNPQARVGNSASRDRTAFMANAMRLVGTLGNQELLALHGLVTHSLGMRGMVVCTLNNLGRQGPKRTPAPQVSSAPTGAGQGQKRKAPGPDGGNTGVSQPTDSVDGSASKKRRRNRRKKKATESGDTGSAGSSCSMDTTTPRNVDPFYASLKKTPFDHLIKLSIVGAFPEDTMYPKGWLDGIVSLENWNDPQKKVALRQSLVLDKTYKAVLSLANDRLTFLKESIKSIDQMDIPWPDSKSSKDQKRAWRMALKELYMKLPRELVSQGESVISMVWRAVLQKECAEASMYDFRDQLSAELRTKTSSAKPGTQSKEPPKNFWLRQTWSRRSLRLNHSSPENTHEDAQRQREGVYEYNRRLDLFWDQRVPPGYPQNAGNQGFIPDPDNDPFSNGPFERNNSKAPDGNSQNPKGSGGTQKEVKKKPTTKAAGKKTVNFVDESEFTLPPTALNLEGTGSWADESADASDSGSMDSIASRVATMSTRSRSNSPSKRNAALSFGKTVFDVDSVRLKNRRFVSPTEEVRGVIIADNLA